ncbi:hypothetical protein JTB14_006868 [Gonioctena quinquepunctata]|nr:hypothetical protein JTB14_006868 [Gonioctena quinquepunctata]
MRADIEKHECFIQNGVQGFILESSAGNDKRLAHSYKRKYSGRSSLSIKKHPGRQKTRMYRCKRCRLEFDSRNNYRKHLYQHHNEKYKICTMCGKSVVNLSQHTNAVHADPGTVRCLKCDKTFSCKKHLHRHMLAHSDEFKHKCRTCGKGFKTPFSMRVHMRSHDAVKPFECSVCLKTFTTKQWRDSHLKTHR